MLTKKRLSGVPRQPSVNHRLFSNSPLVAAFATVCVGLASLPRKSPTTKPIEILAVVAQDVDSEIPSKLTICITETHIEPEFDGSSLTSFWAMEGETAAVAPDDIRRFIVLAWAAEDLIPEMTGIFNYGCGFQLP